MSSIIWRTIVEFGKKHSIEETDQVARKLLGLDDANLFEVKTQKKVADEEKVWRTTENGKHYQINEEGDVIKGPRVMKGTNVNKPSTWKKTAGKTTQKTSSKESAASSVSSVKSGTSLLKAMSPSKRQSAIKDLQEASGVSIVSEDFENENKIQDAENKAIEALINQKENHTKSSDSLSKYMKSKLAAAGGEKVFSSEEFRNKLTDDEKYLIDESINTAQKMNLGNLLDSLESTKIHFRAMMLSIVNKGLGGKDIVKFTMEKWEESRGQRKAPEEKEKEAKEAEKQRQARIDDIKKGNGEYTKKAEMYHVEMRPVKKLTSPITKNQIVKKIAKDDRTGGSCMSAAFAYIANRMGFDVKDFRGGNSKKVVGNRRALYDLVDSPGVKCEHETSGNDLEAARSLLLKMKPKKEYLLVTGNHASIVRLASDGETYEYLELQNRLKCGFRSFGANSREIDSTLRNRFGCKKKQKHVWSEFYGR